MVLDGSDSSQVEDLKLTLGEYLENVRNGLLSKKLIYEDELGIVSVQ